MLASYPPLSMTAKYTSIEADNLGSKELTGTNITGNKYCFRVTTLVSNYHIHLSNNTRRPNDMVYHCWNWSLRWISKPRCRHGQPLSSQALRSEWDRVWIKKGRRMSIHIVLVAIGAPSDVWMVKRTFARDAMWCIPIAKKVLYSISLSWKYISQYMQAWGGIGNTRKYNACPTAWGSRNNTMLSRFPRLLNFSCPCEE